MKPATINPILVASSFGIHEAYLKSYLLFSNGCLQGPGKFYKGRSQEKTLLRWLELFSLRSPLDEAGSVLSARTRCSVAGRGGPVVWVFSTSGFHRLFATKPVCSETSKAES
jgi:hypothetical protein